MCVFYLWVRNAWNESTLMNHLVLACVSMLDIRTVQYRACFAQAEATMLVVLHERSMVQWPVSMSMTLLS